MKQPEVIQRLTMSVEEAGRKIGLSRNSSYAAVRRGDFPAKKIGGRYIVPIAAFEAWLNDRDAA